MQRYKPGLLDYATKEPARHAMVHMRPRKTVSSIQLVDGIRGVSGVRGSLKTDLRLASKPGL